MSKKGKSSTKERRGRRRGQLVVAEKILDLLSSAACTLDSLGNFAYNPYPYVYASLGHVHSKETIDAALTNLVKKGLVEGNKEEGWRITPAGAELKKRLIRARQEEWDGKWRAVFFDIPETQRGIRDGLRFELKKLGFGLWQRSVWVTPFDIAKELNLYLRQHNLSRVVQIVVGERLGDLSDREFAAEVWPLSEINEKYKKLLSAWDAELKKERSAEERLGVVISLHNRYLDILRDDPQLPLELLPPDWAGDAARNLFEKLKSIMVVGRPS